ncbi:MAG: hypothetical protein ABWY45_07785 [Mycobacterium sp.]
MSNLSARLRHPGTSRGSSGPRIPRPWREAHLLPEGLRGELLD